MTDSPAPGSPAKLTTDPPRPPGTPDVDDLVRDPAAQDAEAGGRIEPTDEDVIEEEDPAAPEPPD